MSKMALVIERRYMSIEESEVNIESGHNKTLGAQGEEAASKYLENKGYEIVDRN